MVWDEKKEKAIELLVANQLNDTEIAKVVGCTRQSIWEWKNKSEFAAELTKRVLDKKKRILEFGEVILYNSYEIALNKIAYDIEHGSPRNSLMAAMWWAEKIGGKPTTKVDISNTTETKDVVDPDAMAKEIEEFNGEE
jgi:hypothetical protein